MKILHSNNASGNLTADLLNQQTTISVTPEFSALVPDIGVGEYFTITLSNPSQTPAFETCKIISRSGNDLTVETGGRDYDNPASSNGYDWFVATTTISVRLTSRTINDELVKYSDEVAETIALGDRLAAKADGTLEPKPMTFQVTRNDYAIDYPGQVTYTAAFGADVTGPEYLWDVWIGGVHQRKGLDYTASTNNTDSFVSFLAPDGSNTNVDGYVKIRITKTA